MKAIIEAREGLYLINIYEKEGRLYDAYVVDEIELMTCNQDRDLRDAPAECTL
ncbi:MAG: hypothetical protein OHK0032_16880 [Thermodesulfovibrionales bacterium]